MDNIYVNDGSYFQPVELDINKEAVESEKLKATQSLPFIDGVSEWFDEQIKLFDSIEYALIKAQEYEQSTPEMLIALNICKQVFESKKGDFDSLKLTFKK